jgi:aarF domain-containing kinase
MWTVAKRLAQASAIGAIGTAGYAKWLVQTEPDNPLSRTFKFWTNAFPIFLHYRVVDAMYPKQGAERDAAFELLHEDYSNRILNTMIDLRGFYIKIGQVFATRADILPRVWVERMQKLEDAVPPRSMDIVRQVIEAEIGKPMESLFVEFDPKPLGSASIGQVHRAKLHNGDVVAVKVQFEEAEGLFRGDIQNMKRFCEVAQPEQVVVFEEIERQFMTEVRFTVSRSISLYKFHCCIRVFSSTTDARLQT